MEDSDNLILLTLKQIGCKFQEESINKLGSDEIISIVLQLFKSLGIDITPFKIIDQSQKYRVANKIRDELKKTFSIQVDFMIFINPNPADTRKLLVSLISRMSAMEPTKPDQQNLTYEERIESEKANKRAQTLQDWKNDEWILPELQDFTPKKRKFLDLNLQEENLRNILLLTSVSSSDFVSLVTSSVSHLGKLQRDQEEKGNQNEPRAAKTSKAKLRALANNNKDAWTVNYKKNTNVADFDSKIDEIVKETETKFEQKEVVEVDQGPTLYELELQFKQKEEDKAKENKEETGEQGEDNVKKEPEFDIEKIRLKHKTELDKIAQVLNEKQHIVVSMEEKINKLESKKQKLEDELKEIKEQNVEIEKKTQELDQLLQLMENSEKSEKELKSACAELEKDIQDIKDEWAKQKNKVVSKIEKYKVTIEENKEKLEEIKSKIKFLETDYDALNQKIRTNQEVKIYLQNEYQNLPKEVSRNVFIKRINEINTSYLKQKSELNKILSDVEDVQKQMGYSTSLVERYSTEIENSLKANPKPDNLTKAILKMFHDYQKIFETTTKNLEEHGTNKLEARDLERKIENFQSKGYENLITKLEFDLQILKQENEKLMHEYQKKAVKMQQHQ